MPLEEAFTNKFISGSKAELQPKIDIELQLPSQHSDAELKVYAQALKLGDIELLSQNADRIGRSPARRKKRAAMRQRISAYGSPDVRMQIGSRFTLACRQHRSVA